uniref:Uncharacterized protein n=1 Tax=Anisakis simplex TaxID=6269 RepID=A0A0M3JJI1_ANISI
LACTETKISIVDALRNETEIDQLTSASTSMPEANEEVSTIALESTHPMLIKPSSTPSTISHMPMFAAPQGADSFFLI